MRNKENFKISFVGLKNRIHHFEYEIDEMFFKNFDNLSVKNCKVKVAVELEKRENYLLFSFFIDGQVHLDCDRCLDEYQQEVFGDYKLIVQLGGRLIENNDNDDDIIALPKNQDYINMAEYIYDYTLLSIPYQRIHSNIADCNKEMVDKMNEEQNKTEKDIDPRWEILNKLKKIDKNGTS